MDNKLTKGRLSDFFSYEWIILVAVIVVAIIAWEWIFSIATVKLTPGQEFVYFYDTEVSAYDSEGFYELFGFKKENSSFSYDVLKFKSESLDSSFNVLSSRLSIAEGDVIITERVDRGEEKMNSADNIISNYSLFSREYTVYTMDELYGDARAYLDKFLKDGQTNSLVFENLDTVKIEECFNSRMSKDNRLRAGEISSQNEIDRIQKLCKDVSDFQYLLDNYSGEDGIFYYSDALETGTKKNYGLLPEMLKGGEKDSALYFRTLDPTTKKLSVKDTVILVFDFTLKQPDLQFETISFLMTVVRKCSNLLA